MVADWGGGVVSIFLQAEEDVDACLNWVGCWRLRSEVRYSLTSDDILLVVQGEYNLCGVLKVIDWGVCGE